MRLLLFSILVAMHTGAFAAEELKRGWWPDEYEDRIIAWECLHCEGKEKAWLVCYKPKKQMEFYLPAAAFKEEGRRTDDPVEVTIRAGDFEKTYHGITEDWMARGHVPLLKPAYDDNALYEALTAAPEMVLSVKGRQTRVRLDGAHIAVTLVRRLCY